MTDNSTTRTRRDCSLASSFERYLQDKGKGRGGEGGNYRRNAARELQRFHEWATNYLTSVPTINPTWRVYDMSDNSDSEPSVPVDVLAEERTRLARERTVLAHIRTGFASFLFGGGVIGLFASLYIDIVGAVFILVGIVFLLTGWGSYVRSNRRTQQLLDEIEGPFRRL